MPGSRGDAAKKSAKSAHLERYPSDNVVAVLNTADRARAVWTVLVHSGFLESEVLVSHGKSAADTLDATTGRGGLTGFAVRVAERFGVKDDEMELKKRYEQALREGSFVLAVLAPTEERKELAARLLREHGAQEVNFLGRFAIQPMRG
jgi:hypothetical protein